MDHLQIRLFGGLEVYSGRTLLPSLPTQKSKSLFGFLALNRDRLFHRDVLCGHFWGDQPDVEARKALRTALWRIRSVLEPAESQRGTYLRVEGQLIGFPGRGSAWVDAHELEACVGTASPSGAAVPSEEQAERLAHAVSLYRGDLLEENYDEWCLLDRERLKLTYLMALETLVAYHRGRRQWLTAIAWGRAILRQDPLREHIHRAIMLSHTAMGDRPSALRQYDVLVATLRHELDIEPMEETCKLYAALRAGEALPAGLPARASAVGPERAGLRASEVEEALEAVYALAGRLERARTALRA